MTNNLNNLKCRQSSEQVQLRSRPGMKKASTVQGQTQVLDLIRTERRAIGLNPTVGQD